MVKRLCSPMAFMITMLAVTLPAFTDSFAGKVVSVTDGDTIQVMHDGKAEKIRLHGVDCPESSQAFGTRAKQFTSEQVFGKYVTVDVKDTDRYGRTVADIITPDGTILNRELVKHGYAWWYKQYAPTDTILKSLQDDARNTKVGLWSDPSPIEPWNFRKGESASTPETSSPAYTQESMDALQAEDAYEEPSTSSGGTVYITDTGTKYHSAGCRHLAKSSYPISIEDAQGSYGPCSVCNP